METYSWPFADLVWTINSASRPANTTIPKFLCKQIPTVDVVAVED